MKKIVCLLLALLAVWSISAAFAQEIHIALLRRGVEGCDKEHQKECSE